jgi:hypothetical protein
MNKHAPCYNDEIAQRILDELSGGRSLRAVCRDQGMPSYRAVRMWIQIDRHGFGARYRQARTIDKAGCPPHYTAEIAERILEQLNGRPHAYRDLPRSRHALQQHRAAMGDR